MKNYFEIRPFARIEILAIPMLLFMILMEKYFPKTYPDGFQSFIIAFEFAQTPGQLHQLFSGFTAETFRDIDTGNYFDFGFMATYTLFLVLFFNKAAKTLRSLRKVGNSIIFICLTPNPKGEHLKIIELGSPPFGG